MAEVFGGQPSVTGKKSLAGVYGVDDHPHARSVLNRTSYNYSGHDPFHEGESRVTVQLEGLPLRPEISGLPEGPEISEETLLSRLSPEQRDELRKKRTLTLASKKANPFSDSGDRLGKELLLLRPPHESILALMQEIPERYRALLEDYGLSRSYYTFLLESYFYQIIDLLRDYTQLQMLFRSIRLQLEKAERQEQAMPETKDLLALHFGGSLHFGNLWNLASYRLDEDSPLKLSASNDPRYRLFGGPARGSSFFARRFNEILDHLRIVDDEAELDTPYFVNLFGEFLREEEPDPLARGIWESLSLGRVLKRPPEKVVSPQDLAIPEMRVLMFFYGLSDALDRDDLRALHARILSAPGNLLFALREAHRQLAHSTYTSKPGIENTLKELAILLHLTEGTAALNRQDFLAAESNVRQAIELDPADPDLWYSLGCVFLLEGNKADAITAFRKTMELQPEYKLWNPHPLLQQALELLASPAPSASGLEELLNNTRGAASSPEEKIGDEQSVSWLDRLS